MDKRPDVLDTHEMNSVLKFAFLAAAAPFSLGRDASLPLDQLPAGWKHESTVAVPAEKLAGFSQRLGGDIVALTNSVLTFRGALVKVNTLTATSEAEAEKVQSSMVRLHKGALDACPRLGAKVFEVSCPDDALVERTVIDLKLPRPEMRWQVELRLAPVVRCEPAAGTDLLQALIQQPAPDEAKVASLAAKFEFGRELRFRSGCFEAESVTFSPPPVKTSGQGKAFLTNEFGELPTHHGIPSVTVKAVVMTQAYRTIPAAKAVDPKWLAATSFWPAGDEGIKKLAGEITSGATSPAEKVAAILTWMRPGSHIQYGGPDAGTRCGTQKVLAQKFGRCWDFSDVFISLCRASGIPARQLAGWLQGKSGHVWAEVIDSPDGWRQVDPTAAGGCGVRYLPFFMTEDGEMAMLYLNLPQISALR